jgi:hypothetical protein
MFCPIRNVFALVVVVGLAWGCGGDRVTTSIAPEVDPPADGVRPASGQVHAGQPLGKLAINGKITQAVVVVTVRQDGAPLSGVTVEFFRSVSGLPANYSWSGSTDANGEARVEIGGGNVSGYYRARAVQDGAVLGSWSSIPVNGGYEVTVDLPVGGKARATGSSSLSSPGIVGSWGYVGTDMVETISENLVTAILEQGLVDSATAVFGVQEFTSDLETSLRDSVWSSIRSFRTAGTFEDQDSTGTWSGTGTWSVNGAILTMVDEEGLVMECSFDLDGDNLTLTFTREQYMRIILQSAGELNEEDQEFFDAMLKEDDVIRFFFEAR